MKTKILFVCTGNRDRSPTAEAIYRKRSDLEVRSAGTGHYANTRLTAQLVEWADAVFVMEDCHEAYIQENFQEHAASKPLFCLHIEDVYHRMDQKLVELLYARVSPLLERFTEPPIHTGETARRD